MALPLHKLATVQLSGLPTPVESFLDPSWSWNRLQQLASAARAINPELGVLRFIQRGPVDGEERLKVPFQIVFTKDDRADLPYDVHEDEKAVPFWEAIAQALPAEMAAAEQRRFEGLPHQRFATAEDAAIYAGFKSMKFGFQGRNLGPDASGEDQRVTTSTPVSPAPLDFMNAPDLARAVLLTAPSAPVDGVSERRFADGLRRNVQFLRETLSKPLEDANAAERAKVVSVLKELQGKRGNPSFEEEHQHGWVAYALGHGGKGWTAFLLQKADCSPFATYGEVSPLAVAVAANDAPAIQALSDAGVSMNVMFAGWPQVFDARHQRYLSKLEDSIISPLAFAASIGAAQAASALLKNGADPDRTTDCVNSPLMFAAMTGDEATVKVLVRHGANLSQANKHQLIPSDIVPQDAEFNGLHSFMERERLAHEAAAKQAPVAGQPTVEHPIESIWMGVRKQRQLAEGAETKPSTRPRPGR